MPDFVKIATRSPKRDVVEVYPKFIIKSPCSDLMIQGSDFYAVWVDKKGMWSTCEQDALDIIDNELDEYVKNHQFEGSVKVLYMHDSDSGSIDRWHKYCQKQMRDSFRMLDETLIFSNSVSKQSDYASKKLNYPLESGDISAWDKLMSTLYSEEERMKIEWAIGSIVSGDSKTIQKFMVLYGAAGTGKSTVLNIIQMLFDGYYCVFDAKALGSANSSFALEPFKTNPLVAIQHDGDLSRIEDNTRLNSLVSHELMTINEKFKSAYSNRFKCFLFMGTNKPVKITDGKSGIIRRLIDVHPSGNKLGAREYKRCMKQIEFELGAIAQHCLDVYLENPSQYDHYIPIGMMGASNDFYNFVLESYHIFKKEDGTTMRAAWAMYKEYCEDAKVPYPLPMRQFKEELKNYFHEFEDAVLVDGEKLRSYYRGFRTDIFESESEKKPGGENGGNKSESWIKLEPRESIFDRECADLPAQYASDNETPLRKWESVTSRLRDLDTSRVHYVSLPGSHIVIDFDLKDADGNKSLALNLEAATKWPPTYAEVSKGGNGLHLHYIYSGDVAKLSRIYDDNIEIKVFTGKSSLRRKLTTCTDIPIATINSGLPLKEEKEVVDFEGIKSEKALRTLIKRNLAKEYHASTRCSIDFIYKNLEDAYKSGMAYDVTDLRNAVYAFAANSTNQAPYCLKKVTQMKFQSDEQSEGTQNAEAKLVFYDVEVFPNLFLVNWKAQGEGRPVVRMINPKPSDIEDIMKFNLVGFNCRRYDNHILYGRLLGYSNEQLYKLSQKIITEGTGFFGEAYNVSYTDVYDFSSKKQSLKKFEIELGIHHQELGLPWDQPVPEHLWTKVAEYCDNDVIATEAVFNARKADFTARKILADVAGMTVNDTTNSLTTRIIFGREKNPKLNYRFMGIPEIPIDFGGDEYTVFDAEGRPEYPGYEYKFGKSTYRGEEVGEGGYVYSEPGMYGNVALLDIASMHPSSIKAENLFGEYTQRFNDILNARIAIKHKDFTTARKMLNGALAKYLDDEGAAADLAQALKIAINSVYGLTSAKFANPFKDPRNVDNIVAKRGALFMINLKHEVQKRGYTVAHIKTDSIKIPDATPEIINFVTEYGKKYGYNFEHEATYDRMCLVNDAVYIAKYKDGKHAGEWTATGTQFQIPYVFKKLFSKEPIEFKDMCETKSVSSSLYLKTEGGDPSDSPEFIGRVGLFCPIKPGCGGKELLRESKDADGNIKYSAATGTKGYLWLEAETVKLLHKEKDIDRSYYDSLCDNAIETISKYGDYEWFVSDDPYIPPYESAGPPWDDDEPNHFALR